MSTKSSPSTSANSSKSSPSAKSSASASDKSSKSSSSASAKSSKSSPSAKSSAKSSKSSPSIEDHPKSHILSNIIEHYFYIKRKEAQKIRAANRPNDIEYAVPSSKNISIDEIQFEISEIPFEYESKKYIAKIFEGGNQFIIIHILINGNPSIKYFKNNNKDESQLSVKEDFMRLPPKEKLDLMKSVIILIRRFVKLREPTHINVNATLLNSPRDIPLASFMADLKKSAAI